MKQTKPKAESICLSPAQQDYLDQCIRRKRLIRAWQWSLLLLFLFLWDIGAQLGWINSFVFCSPTGVIRTILEMSKSGMLWYHTGITLLETFISFFLILLFGIVCSVLLWWNETLSKILEPYLVVLNSLPKSALAPVFIVWLGANQKTIIVAAVSVAVFGAILTLYHSFSETEEEKIRLIYTLGGTKKDVLQRIVLPASIPTLFSLMKVNLGLSLVGVIIGEFLAARAGLGYLVIYGSQVFRLDLVITSIVLLCLLSALLYQIISRLERRL